MKISLLVDAGYAYDFLSILNVKINKSNTAIAKSNFDEQDSIISSQVGSDLHKKIMSSEYYKHLYLVNSKLFDLVELVKKDPCLGKQVDDMVYERFKAKQALQNKFFPSSSYSEQKIGYT